MRRTLTALTVLFLSLTPAARVSADGVPPVMDPAAAELSHQLRNPKTPPIKYWLAVAQCETGSNWQDKGRFAGGLGIYVGTWRNYGGRQFAPHPAQATPTEQMVVANRIAVYGYQTKNDYLTLEDKLNNRPYFRPRAGFFGWGCVANNKYLHPRKWVKRYGS